MGCCSVPGASAPPSPSHLLMLSCMDDDSPHSTRADHWGKHPFAAQATVHLDAFAAVNLGAPVTTRMVCLATSRCRTPGGRPPPDRAERTTERLGAGRGLVQRQVSDPHE